MEYCGLYMQHIVVLIMVQPTVAMRTLCGYCGEDMIWMHLTWVITMFSILRC